MKYLINTRNDADMLIYRDNADCSHDIIIHHLLNPEFANPLTRWFAIKYIHSNIISDTFTERQKYIIQAMLNKDHISHIVNSLSLSQIEYSKHHVEKMYESYISSIADDIYNHINYLGHRKKKSL